VSLGIAPGSNIGIYSHNQPEWIIAEYACYAFGFTPIALYDTLGSGAVSFVIAHAEIKVVVCTMKLLANIASGETPELQLVVVTDGQPVQSGGARVMAMQSVEEVGSTSMPHTPPASGSVLATVMYTSGVAGSPKGVMLSHDNFIAEIAGVRAYENGLFSSADVHLSYLPLAHSFERCLLGVMISVGARIGFFSGSIESLTKDINCLKPSFLVGAPRVWQRMHDKIVEKMNKSWFERMFFTWGVSRKSQVRKSGENSAFEPILDRFIFSKTKQLLGGRVRFILSGAAPLDPKLAEFLGSCFCCPIIQGYGLTENLAGAFVTALGDKSTGHVGAPLPCVECKLIDVPGMEYWARDHVGEICLRGPTLFSGYYADEAKTREDLGEDGWFRTGDIGRFWPNGTMSVIDRKKNIFKLAQGEYIATEYLEQVYMRSALVQQIFVHGESTTNFVVAIVVPDPEVILPMAREMAIEGDLLQLCRNEAVKEQVLHMLEEQAKQANLHRFEYLKRIHLEPSPFTVENGLVAPTFKLLRLKIKEHYADVLRELCST
jgi:long-chain acyl-CoA synthetase